MKWAHLIAVKKAATKERASMEISALKRTVAKAAAAILTAQLALHKAADLAITIVTPKLVYSYKATSHELRLPFLFRGRNAGL